jgi:hypothetical protein
MTTFLTSEYCMSAGSILVESDIIATRTTRTSVAGRQDSTDPIISARVHERQIPAAPFDNPGTLPFHRDGSQSRRTVFVRDLGDPRLSLTASIPVALDLWEGSVTACCYDLEDFGVGQDEFSAITDLKVSLVDLYFLLKADADRLGPLPQRQWNYLRSIALEK